MAARQLSPDFGKKKNYFARLFRDIRMDWTRDHELQTAGKIRASVNL